YPWRFTDKPSHEIFLTINAIPFIRVFLILSTLSVTFNDASQTLLFIRGGRDAYIGTRCLRHHRDISNAIFPYAGAASR
ncbi:hypothetical protein, partial [Raoultella ornithinolytica]|uniref:hypothetical protein n=1 Tax=Raoultella ornithinolytica TaxID=54291 RepID=UPI002876115B|nr:hypothetical protein [Raoultella ornithinolytica]